MLPAVARTPERIKSLGRPSAAELRELVRVLVVMLSDSEQTEQLMGVEEILNRRRIAELLASDYFDSDDGRDLLRDRPILTSKTVDLDGLRALPAHTVGGAFVRHLDEHGLDLDLFDAPTPILADEPDIAWVVMRNRQTHDIWHMLLGLGVQGYEEILVHAFCLGNTGVQQSLFIVLFGAIKHMVLEARWDALARGLRGAYDMGRRAAPMWSVYWERRWHEPVDEVRARLGVAPLSAATGQ